LHARIIGAMQQKSRSFSF